MSFTCNASPTNGAYPHSAHPMADGSTVEETVIPDCLLTAASIEGVWRQEVPKHVSPQPMAASPDGDLCIPKRRPPTPSWKEARRRQPSQAYGLQKDRTNVYPVPEDGPTVDTPHGLGAHPHPMKQSMVPRLPLYHFKGTGDKVTSPIQPTLDPSSFLGMETRKHNKFSRRLFSLSHTTTHSITGRVRDTSPWSRYDRTNFLLIEYGTYTLFIVFVYFVLVGVLLWKGAVSWLYWLMQNKFVFQGGWSIVIGLVIFYSFLPLLITFEKDAPDLKSHHSHCTPSGAPDTALLIPCHKSAPLIYETLEAVLKIFPPSHVFVLANGDSPTPLDNTEEICRSFGVNHVWIPVGSKIIALLVGCYAAKRFRQVLLIYDDCVLSRNFPIVVSRLTKRVRCIGYTLKVVGSFFSKGTYCQQAQDLEYKLSGLQRTFAGRIGSATFPHGAIWLWEREFPSDALEDHPGFSIRRIQMCSAVFVETSAPPAVFYTNDKDGRSGFGEMTVFRQRFTRWNFFVANGLRYNLAYSSRSWELGRWEIAILGLLAPFMLPISLPVRANFCIALLMGTMALYLIKIILFNEIHLRLKHERVRWKVIIFYYMPYKFLITIINIGSNYWSLLKYAKYFAQRRPKIIEDHKAIGTVLRLEESALNQQGRSITLGRSMTVRSVDVRSQMDSRAGLGRSRMPEIQELDQEQRWL
ncbi:uncharacterized protein BO88DRAFT_466248 [Aspergillus vadensis CBS 113365]|uniref:Glycosyl transferase n=2 Tax=Aspergillus subgen. Circumdati TaxID=2720871 RepID=A0A319BMW7_ASPVC|nr:hypothetical protein BO88DRAFT_466248 [Aspergillus vadensis CBS 113365]PYH67043.1 hypothetical protein BO88DRAFT_466248 [Aspergillus vadensis CBS 113365]